jgi:zinc D-Ala-D-Ala dipeptidase
MRTTAPRNRRSILVFALWAAALPVAAVEPVVDISRACPGVVVELRYATARNITGKPIYPPGSRALLRRSVADRLNRAQAFVRERGFSLKVWDAYRPVSVQRLLWNAVRNPAYVVEPSRTGSLHNWAAAVDVTLVDVRGREARMPTDFDAFSTAARYDYKGNDPEIAFNLSTLKRAMAEAGFRHIRDEWWHYSVSNEPGFGPIEVPLVDASAVVAKAARDETVKSADADTSGSSNKKKPRSGRLVFPRRAGETL